MTQSFQGMNRAALLAVCFILFVSPAPMSCGAEAQTNDDFATILTAGRAALEDERYETAQKQFELYLSRTNGIVKETEDVAVLLVRSLYLQKKYAEILELLKPKRGKVPQTGAFTYWRAAALYETAKCDDSLKEMNDFETRFPDNIYGPRVQRLRAWCYLKSGKSQQALDVFQAFDKEHKDSPESADNMLEWAQALVVAGQVDQARDVLTRLVKLSPNLEPVQKGTFLLGEILSRTLKWDEALVILGSVCTNTSVREDLRAQGWFTMAKIHEARTNRVETVNALSNGVTLARSPELKRKGSYDLGRNLLESGKIDDGVSLLRAFVLALPGDRLSDTAQLQLATSLLEHGRNQQAIDEFQRYVETFTNSTGQAQAQSGMGLGLMNMRRFGEAATAFNKAYGLFSDIPGKEKSLFKVGDAYFSNLQYKLAAETYKRFLKEYPDSKLAPSGFFQLAESQARGGEMDKAYQTFKELSAKFAALPVAEEAMLRCAEIRSIQERWNDALGDFNRMLAVFSNGVFTAEALKERGIVNYNTYKFLEALDDFNRVTTEYTNNPAAEQSHYMKAMCAFSVGRDEEALAICREFLKRYPASRWAPSALFWIGNFLYNQGMYDVAETNFLQYAEKYRGNPMADEALLWAGRAASKRKEFVRSVETLTRLVREYTNSTRIVEARFEQADALRELAKDSEAILICEEIINKYPGSSLVAPAWVKKGDCQHTLGLQNKKRYDESIESYRVVANSSTVDPDLAMEARYKIGSSLEKLGRTKEAIDQYYVKVMIRYLDEREKGIHHSEAAKGWFTRAAFHAADLLEKPPEPDWKGAVNVLKRVVDAGVPAADEAKKMIEKIKNEHWVL